MRKLNLQLPKINGHDCRSIGKFLNSMGHDALIVNLINIYSLLKHIYQIFYYLNLPHRIQNLAILIQSK